MYSSFHWILAYIKITVKFVCSISTDTKYVQLGWTDEAEWSKELTVQLPRVEEFADGLKLILPGIPFAFFV